MFAITLSFLCLCIGTHEQFDLIIWPHVESTSMVPHFIGRYFKKEMAPEDKFKIAFDIYFKEYKDQLYGGRQPSRALCAEPMSFLCSKLSTSWYCDNKLTWPEHASNVPIVS